MKTNRNITYYVNEIKPIQFCDTVFYQLLGGAFELPFETEPTVGDHNLKSCEGCQNQKIKLVPVIQQKLNQFPFCCEPHKKLLSLEQFQNSKYINTAESITNKILYTYHHIINFIDSDNWEKDLTDYIQYSVESFGRFPESFGPPVLLSNYFHYLLQLLDDPDIKSNKISPSEIKRRLSIIIKFLKSFSSPNTNNKSDLNILLQTYQNWLKIFPFELNVYFGNLKNHFEKQIPILTGKADINKYTGVETFKLHTKDTLIESLLRLTKDLLYKINGVNLYEKGLISDSDKIQFDLIINSRKLEIENHYNDSSATENQRYRKILKKWFADEKKFVNDIKPFLSLKANQIEDQVYPTIFVDKGFPIFRKWHEIYKTDSKPLANFSYIFNALKKDGFLICSGVEFIKFLAENYDIHLDKIDARQTGSDNKRYNVYKNLVESS